MFLHFSQPVIDIVETLSVRDVVGEDDSVRPFIVSGSDGFEPLLSGGVPNVQFNWLVIDVQVFDLEIHSDGREEGVVENVVRKP